MDLGILVPILALAVPVMAIGSRMLGKWTRLREKELELAAMRVHREDGRSDPAIAALEQRLRVLERIVTDRGLTLSDEIDRLRDRPELAATSAERRPPAR